MGQAREDRVNEVLNKAKELEELTDQRNKCRNILDALSRHDEAYTLAFSGTYTLRVMKGSSTDRLLGQAICAEILRLEWLMDAVLEEEV